MRIWITRAQPEAEATAERLRALGHEPVAAPLVEVQPADEALDLDGVGALAFTSRNGLRAFAVLWPDRSIPVFAVGDATARAAAEAGFKDVSSAAGDVVALAALIASRRQGLEGVVLHLAPEEPAGDLVQSLRALQIPARSQSVYRTVPTDLAVAPTGIDAVLIHSPKAARRLAEIPALHAAAPSQAAICISAAAAQPLEDLGFSEVLIASAPNETALLQRLDSWDAVRRPPRLFPPMYWIAVAFAATCIVAAILVAGLGPRLFPAAARHPAPATAQPLQFRGKSG